MNHLRGMLGESAVLSDRQNVQLSPELALWTDVNAMEAGEGGASPLGELLEEFYDEWVSAPREHYRGPRHGATVSK